MFVLHFQPTEKTVEVVYEEDRKAYYNRDIACISHRSNDPEENQHYVICGVSKGIEGTAPESEVHGGETCSNGDGAEDKAPGAEIFKNKEKQNGDCRGEKNEKWDFPKQQRVDLNLGFFALVGVFKPRDKGKEGHGCRHSQVGYHLAVVTEPEGDYSVKNAEYYHQHLGQRVALCGKYQGGNADERGAGFHRVASVEKQK